MTGTLEQRGGICRPVLFGKRWISQRALPALRHWLLPLGLLALATALTLFVIPASFALVCRARGIR